MVAEGLGLDAIRTQLVRPESGYAWPTAVYISTDEILFADDALAHGLDDPARLIQDFITSVGDPSAVYTIDDVQFTATDLYAWTVDNIAGRVAAVRHAEPTGIWAVIPAWWSEDRVDALAAALDRDGRTEVDFITATKALASRYLLTDPANPDLTVIVCDVDEHALQAAIVRQVPGTRSRQISPPIHSLISPAWARDDAVDEHAVDLLALAVSEAGVDIDAVDAIVLAGFSERVADFGRLLAARFGDPIDTDPHPDWASAAGAAVALAREIAPAGRRGNDGCSPRRADLARAAPAWYRRPARLATIGVGAAALVSVVVVASAFAIGGIGPSETETDPPVSEISPIDERASTGVPSASPSATPLPTTDAAVPPTITEPSVPETPTAPVSRRPNSPAPVAPVPSTPAVAPAPTTPDPPAPAPPVDGSDPNATSTPTAPVPQPTVDPEPPVEPTPSPEPSPRSRIRRRCRPESVAP